MKIFVYGIIVGLACAWLIYLESLSGETSSPMLQIHVSYEWFKAGGEYGVAETVLSYPHLDEQFFMKGREFLCTNNNFRSVVIHSATILENH